MKHIKQNTRLILIISTFIVIVSLSILSALKIINNSLLLGLIGLMATFYFGYLKNRIEDDKVFKELFDSFSTKYDGKMNDLLNELRNTQSKRPLTIEEKNLVIDYFNLCAEEYLWKKKKRINDDVWDAWKAGIEDNLEISQIGSLFLEEIDAPRRKKSYYGLDQELSINELVKDYWLNNKNNKAQNIINMNNLFIQVNNDTIDSYILANVIDFIEERLDNDIKKVIIENNFYLLLATSPGCLTSVHSDPQVQLNKLIVIDKTLSYDLLKFNNTEVAAEILHEVGHLLNKEPIERYSESEFYADDFVRKCELGCQLLNGLKKYKTVIELYSIKTKYPFFETFEKQNQIIEMFRKRIVRIENNEPLLLSAINKN
jgi:hypothetical protein